MSKATDFLRSLVSKVRSSEPLNRAFHTFWEVALGVFVAGIFAAHNSAQVKALVVTSVAAGAAAVRNSLIRRKG